MDYDNDGIQDIISGSYDPGDVYLIKGLGDGKYAKVQQILDEQGVPLVHHPIEMAKYQEYKREQKEKAKQNEDSSKYIPDSDEATNWRVASFGSWPATIDWDDDDDLDMLIGTFGGKLFIRMNIGSRKEPKYGKESVQIKAAGKPIQVKGHANPVVADWDQDGLWDLVIGSSDGSVGWYRNTGKPGAPMFSAQQILVTPKADSKFMIQNIKNGESPAPGVRGQICVTDYNNDGLPDLIVGDYKDVNLIKELSDDEQIEFDGLVVKEKEYMARVTKRRAEFTKRFEALSEENVDEEKERLTEEYSASMEAFSKEYESFAEELKQFYTESSRASNIWLYLRKPSMMAQNPSAQKK